MLDDLHHAVRAFLKTPSFAVPVVLTLALGIGANTAIFTVVNSVLLKPLRYRSPDELVVVWQKRPERDRVYVSPRNFEKCQEQGRTFSRMSAFAGANFSLTTSGAAPEQVLGARVSPDFFSVIGVAPALGRDFLPEEKGAGNHHVVILGDQIWKRRFGAERNIIGRAIHLNGEPYTVVGVMAQDFLMLSTKLELWTPLAIDPQAGFDAHNLIVFARMRPGARIQDGRRDMESLARRLELESPNTNKGWGVTVASLQQEIVGDVEPALRILMGAVALVLLIACGNVASLMLMRAAAREREIAMRNALGARRGRIVRQLLAEAAVLGLAGGFPGILLAFGGVRILRAAIPADFPRLPDIVVDGRVLLFTVTLSVLAALLCCLLPLRRMLKPNLYDALKQGFRGSTGSTGVKAQAFLVIVQVALSVVLFTAAGSLLRSLFFLQDVDRGFNPAQLLTAQISVPNARYPASPQIIAFHRKLLARLAREPQIESAATTSSLPLDGQHQVGMYFRIEGRALLSESQRATAACNLVSPDYFRAMRIPISKGRPFNDEDREGKPFVAIVSDSLARRYLPGENPIGRRIVVGSPGIPGRREIVREIVGVAGDVRYPVSGPAYSIEIYLPFEQSTWPNLLVTLRTRSTPASAAGALRNAVHDVDDQQPVSDVESMEERLQSLTAQPRANGLLMGIFALVALILAAIGIFGVVSYSTIRRTREIGLRIALGALPGNVLGLVLRRGSLMTVAGIGVGLAAWLLLCRLLQAVTYGVSLLEWKTLAAASIVLCLTGLIAGAIPAWRATRVDPVTALREE